MAEPSVAVTAYLSYRVEETGTSGDSLAEGRPATNYYRIYFNESDAREVYQFFRDDVARQHDRAEIIIKLIREALHQEDFPASILLEGFTIRLGEEPAEGTDFPLGESAYVYRKVRVALEEGGRSYDWVRGRGEDQVRLLGKGRILAPLA